jgi:hypothetical protein
VALNPHPVQGGKAFTMMTMMLQYLAADSPLVLFFACLSVWSVLPCDILLTWATVQVRLL